MFSEVTNISPRDPSLRCAPFDDDKRGLLQCYKISLFSTLINPALVILERKRRISGGDVCNININLLYKKQKAYNFLKNGLCKLFLF